MNDLSIVIVQTGAASAALPALPGWAEGAAGVVIVQTMPRGLTPDERETLPTGTVCIECLGASLAVAGNAGLERAHTRWAILATTGSCLLAPDTIARALAIGDELDAVLVAFDRAAPADGGASPLGLDDLIGANRILADESPFRVLAWQQLDGFAPETAGWSLKDFRLRVVEAGMKAVCVPVQCSLASAPRAQAELSTLASIASGWSRHRAVVSTHAANAVAEVDRRCAALSAAAADWQSRHESLQREMDVIQHEMAAVKAALLEVGVPALEWGDFDRLSPFSQMWGADRGQCVDRLYIDTFLAAHAADVKGVVLEIHDDDYTRRFGGVGVTRSDVLDIDPGNIRATVVGDLRNLVNVEDATYDCIILTQTLHLIFAMQRALSECRRLLKPGGVLLVTVPTASRIAPEQGRNDFWRFTTHALKTLLMEAFPGEHIEVEARGNLCAALGYLYGLAVEDLPDLSGTAPSDPSFPLVVCARVRRQSIDAVAQGSFVDWKAPRTREPKTLG